MKRAIFARAAVICFALAAAGTILLIGLLANIEYEDIFPFSIVVGGIVFVIFWPACPYACTRTRVEPLPYCDSESLAQEYGVSEDGRKGIFVESGEAEDA